MGLFNSINVSATGMTAERTRMDIISENIANANTTKTSNGTPYNRKMIVFEENKPNFSTLLNDAIKSTNNSSGVKIKKIVEDETPYKKVYEPGHPDANEDGYVEMPNVDVVKEMVDMISATRAYEANITSLNSSKSMFMKALEIGR
ncbi:flagellar basal body rod protein FlgC [Clostridium sp. D2Q-11]|uniref:Flagellar basal-body rod protein FlgC n=1 Tax=Anaeromonas frigoriresistens TaxID=2683708 RepID=A0A942UZV7_9FIRM|nr:flagellar basal body rod protein FlgC [Anaeromonas frigoriresistens]MBS4539839.1 flagellar basal body rod protein FlgC [Anaeromonas frigoriresistens]